MSETQNTKTIGAALQQLHDAQKILSCVYGDFEKNDQTIRDLMSCADSCIWDAINHLEELAMREVT